jgi:hypothetical protein
MMIANSGERKKLNMNELMARKIEIPQADFTETFPDAIGRFFFFG